MLITGAHRTSIAHHRSGRGSDVAAVRGAVSACRQAGSPARQARPCRSCVLLVWTCLVAAQSAGVPSMLPVHGDAGLHQASISCRRWRVPGVETRYKVRSCAARRLAMPNATSLSGHLLPPAATATARISAQQKCRSSTALSSRWAHARSVPRQRSPSIRREWRMLERVCTPLVSCVARTRSS